MPKRIRPEDIAAHDQHVAEASEHLHKCDSFVLIAFYDDEDMDTLYEINSKFREAVEDEQPDKAFAILQAIREDIMVEYDFINVLSGLQRELATGVLYRFLKG